MLKAISTASDIEWKITCLISCHAPHPTPPYPTPPHPQANLARLDGSKSLLMSWVEAVLGKLATYVNWPVRSLKMDDLLLQYIAREQRDAAGLVYTLTVDTDAGALVNVNITSTSGAAAAPIMVGTNAAIAGAQVAQGPAAGDAVSTKVLSLTGPGSTVSLSVTGVTW